MVLLSLQSTPFLFFLFFLNIDILFSIYTGAIFVLNFHGSVYTVAGMHIIFTKRYHWYGPSVEKKSTVWKIFLSLCLSLSLSIVLIARRRGQKMRRLYMVCCARVNLGMGDCGWKNGGSWWWCCLRARSYFFQCGLVVCLVGIVR